MSILFQELVFSLGDSFNKGYFFIMKFIQLLLMQKRMLQPYFMAWCFLERRDNYT
jgi:hypothetical protein